jgi:hypothetical protein
MKPTNIQIDKARINQLMNMPGDHTEEVLRLVISNTIEAQTKS